jgi:hypothetical protein
MNNNAFSQTGLIEIIILSSVEVLGEKYFSQCTSFSPVTFESGSRLSRIENKVSLQIEHLRPSLHNSPDHHYTSRVNLGVDN